MIDSKMCFDYAGIVVVRSFTRWLIVVSIHMGVYGFILV